ncbi:SET domain-containing protein-lysine N-methyltransferase [Actinoplanes sp. NPDC049548]|uniref:SET domain-containing protein-lysine N-methyltransferase n=1 Tax=Actinoplanes sp. NPDC049548 TaxID=3155152 RepID=UPI0034327D27
MTVDSIHAITPIADEFVAVVRTHGEYRLVLDTHVCAGARLFTIRGDVTRTPTRYSLQVGRDTHIDMPDGYDPEQVLDRFFWRFTNHSCEPNAVVRGREFVALHCIEPWSQITFNYNTTEFDMAEPFDCRCGSPQCEGVIRGYRWLSPEARQRVAPLLADHLRGDRSPVDAAEV